MYGNGATKSGVYVVSPGIRAYCSMGLLEHGWTVILRRLDKSQDFLSKTYQEFIDGFGDFSENYFLGLDSIHQMTRTGTHKLYIGLDYPASTGLSSAFALYDSFSVGNNESGYKLSLGSYSSSSDGPDSTCIAGGDPCVYHNGAAFSAKGSPKGHCGNSHGPWWYSQCDHPLYRGCNYMRWYTLHPNEEILNFVMAIRRVN